jgi:hypothetical protein
MDWEELGLVFPSRLGTPMEPDNLRRSWGRISQAAVRVADPRSLSLIARVMVVRCESSISAMHIERTAHPVPQGDVSAGQRNCGQGQDRTVDLPLFRSTALSATAGQQGPTRA